MPADSSSSLSMLYVIREKYPTFRVDVTELFSIWLTRKGFSVDWACQSEAPSEEATLIKSPRERVFLAPALEHSGVVRKVANHLLALLHDLKLYGKVQRGEYDIVQVRDKFVAGLVVLIAAKRKKIPFCYWMSYPFPEADAFRAADRTEPYSPLRRLIFKTRSILTAFLLYKVIMPRAAHIFVQSDRMKQDVCEHGIDSNKMTPIPMGLSLEQLDKQPAEIDDPRLRGRLPIVYVGTMIRVRRMEFVIQAFAKVVERVPGAILVMIGDGEDSDMQFLRGEAARLGLEDDVLFTGFVDRAAAWGYIRASKLCVSLFPPSPELDSTTPTKVVEYLAWNRPVVANDHPDQSRVLGESGAGLAVPFELGAFADAMIELLEDPERARSMGLKGLDYVRKFRSYDSISNGLILEYERVVSDFAAVKSGRGAAVTGSRSL